MGRERSSRQPNAQAPTLTFGRGNAPLYPDMRETDPQRQFVLHTLAETQAIAETVRSSAAASCQALAGLLRNDDPLNLFRAMKFGSVGFDSLDATRPANLLEQVHRTFMYLTSLRAVEYLLEKHPEHAPYHLHFGKAPGPDIESADGEVVAEACAVVTPLNNNKLKFDIERMRGSQAPLRYVFYSAEEDRDGISDPEVDVVAIIL